MNNPAALVVYVLFEETSSSESDSSDSENEDDNLLLHDSAALIDRRPIPKLGSFYDIITNYDDQEFRRHFRLTRGELIFKKYSDIQILSNKLIHGQFPLLLEFIFSVQLPFSKL